MNGEPPQMDCPSEEGAPTLKGELKRGVNPYNLSFGAVAALALGIAIGWALQSPAKGAIAVAAWFVALTVTHTVAHATMGWIFERGLRYHCEQRYDLAERWLALAEKPGMDHYDPHGVALKALRECQELRRSRSSSKADTG